MRIRRRTRYSLSRQLSPDSKVNGCDGRNVGEEEGVTFSVFPDAIRDRTIASPFTLMNSFSARILVGIVAPLAGVSLPSLSAAADRSMIKTDLDRELRAMIERGDVPGVVAFASDRRGVLYEGAFGMAEKEAD